MDREPFEDLSAPEDEMDGLECRIHLETQGVDVDAFLDRVEKKIAEHIPGFKIKRTHHLKQSRS